MRKLITMSVMMLAVLALAAAPVFAGENCSADKTASKSCSADKATAQKASAKGSTCSAEKTAIKASADGACSATANATMASAKSCSPADMEACAKALNMSVEDVKKMCGPEGTMAIQTISIQGMTCAGCEQSITKAIEGVDGVHKVVSISHKDANAVVCVEKDKACLETLTKTITNKGYKAEIIPAVATSTTADSKMSSCSKTCTAAEKAACASKTAEKTADKKAEGTK